jgi:hypothetical protein
VKSGDFHTDGMRKPGASGPIFREHENSALTFRNGEFTMSTSTESSDHGPSASDVSALLAWAVTVAPG